MRKCLVGVVVVWLFVFSNKVNAQADELAQLALNIEKLAQFKQILSDLKKGYQILSGGYNTIKDLSQGNFKLHETFLNGLYTVSPSVKKYSRIGDIINSQVRIVKIYQSSLKQLRGAGVFSPDELNYFSGVFSGVSKKALSNLEDLALILTSGKTRMNDEERMAAIDKIYGEMSDKELFVKSFSADNNMLLIQRKKELKNTELLRKLY